MTIERGVIASLPVTSERVASELHGMRDRLEHLERRMETLFAEDLANFDAKTVAAIQEIDMLMQSAAALAEFVQRMAKGRDEVSDLDLDFALQAVTLRDMAIRLKGGTNAAVEVGVPELF